MPYVPKWQVLDLEQDLQLRVDLLQAQVDFAKGVNNFRWFHEAMEKMERGIVAETWPKP